MKRQVERVLRLTLGSLLLLIGVIGGFIPVMQGWIFVIAGLTLMAPESRRARRALDWAKSKVKSRVQREGQQTREDGGCQAEAADEPVPPKGEKVDSDE